MSSQIKSPGTELIRLMDAIGFPEQAAELSGAALDRVIQNDRGIATNSLDAYSQLPTSEFFGGLKQGKMGEPGYFRKPNDALRHAREHSRRTYYDREQIQTFNLRTGGMFSGVHIDGKFISTVNPMTAAQFEKKLNNDPEFYQRIEEQIGGRILCDGNTDGKITISKKIQLERLSSSRVVSGLIKHLRQLFMAFCLFINPIVAIHAFADLPPLIPRQVLFGNEERIAARISPDGTMLAYLAPDQGVMNVWVRTMGKNDDRVITADRKRGIRSLVWQWDSRHLFYDQDVDGDENWHFYQTNLETKMTRDLTPFKGIQARLVAFDPKFPDQMLVALNIRDPQLHDVYRLNLKTGAVELDTQNPGDVGGWTADHNFQVRVAAVVTPDGGSELRIRDDANSPWRTFKKWSADETFGEIAAFSPDNQRCWIYTSVDANAARLLEVDLKSGSSTVIAQDPQYDVNDILVHPVNHKLQAVQFVRSRSELKVIDPAIQADFDLITKTQRGDFWVTGRDLADKNWIVGYLMDDGPLYYYHYDRSTKKITKLFSDRPALETYKLSRTEPISYTARDGMTIHGYLTLPVGLFPKNLPMVLNVHGGPWWRDTWGYNNQVQWLANRGYAVLQINFRGSTGYGKQYLNAGNREWAGKMHTDLIDGKNWVAKQGIADPKRVCIMGASYGGYATLVGLAFTPDEFACGVDLVGPSNLVTFIKTTPPYWAPSVKIIFEKRMGKETEEEFLKSRSPLFKVDQIKAPLLIAHGANDPRIKQAESDQMVQAIRKNGKTVEYLLFPDEGHGFARPENNLIYYAAVEQFLAKYLGGRAEPVSEKDNAEPFRK